MKKGAVLLALVFLSGCAHNDEGRWARDLRSDAHFRGERVLPMTFAQIQMALFKHEAACGSAPEFALEPRQTSYATLTVRPVDAIDDRQVILADLMYYRASDLGGWLAKDEDRDWRTRAKIYSFYAGSEVDARIDQMFRAITNPGECAGQSNAPSVPDTGSAAVAK